MKVNGSFIDGFVIPERGAELKMTFKVISQRNSGSKADRARMIATLWDDEGVVRYYEIIQGPKETVRIRATDEALKFVEFLKACGASIEPDYDVQFEDRMN